MKKLISTSKVFEQVSFKQPFELGKRFDVPDRERNIVPQFWSSHTESTSTIVDGWNLANSWRVKKGLRWWVKSVAGGISRQQIWYVTRGKIVKSLVSDEKYFECNVITYREPVQFITSHSVDAFFCFHLCNQSSSTILYTLKFRDEIFRKSIQETVIGIKTRGYKCVH